jgi:serine phosphatase RsbU (regulator of sigma subunit)
LIDVGESMANSDNTVAPVSPVEPKIGNLQDIPFLKRLKIKLVLSFLILGYTPVALMSTYAYQQAKKGFFKQVGQNTLGISELVNDRLTQEINRANSQLQIASRNNDALNASAIYGAEQIVFQLLQTRFRNYLINQKRLLPIFKSIHAVRLDPKSKGAAFVLYSTDPQLEGTTLFNDFWVKSGNDVTVNQKYVWGDENYQSSDKKIMPISVFYKGTDDEPLALVGSLDITYLKSVIENMLVSGKSIKEHAKTGDMHVALVSRRQEVLATTYDPAKAADLVKLDFTGGYIVKRIPIMGDAFIGRSVAETSYLRTITMTKARTAIAPIYNLRYASVVTGSFLLIVLFLLGVQISHRITQPIMRLVSTTQNVARGDLHQSVEVENNDEIGILSGSFNVMVEKLRISFDQSKKLAALEKDMELSSAVQELLMPKDKDVDSQSVKLTSFYKSADKLGGDWWWFYERADGTSVVLMGDVTGHGASSAMVVAAIAGSFRTLQNTGEKQGMDTFLNILNQTLLDLCNGDYWMTVSALEILPAERKVVWWNAGAPPLFMAQTDGGIKTLLARGNSLGMNKELKLGRVEQTYNPGDRILVFTDGLYEFETKLDKEYGLPKLKKCFHSTQEMPIADARVKIFEEVELAKKHQSYEDDITYIIVELKDLA